MGDADYLHAFQSIVMPIALEFNPELVISESHISACERTVDTMTSVSAGFDPADGDELGECHVSPTGYRSGDCGRT